MTGRLLLGLGSLVRLAVGVGYLTNPEAMARRGLAPDIRGDPDGRMSTRGFGALHTGIAMATLRAAARNKSCRELAVLNLGCALGPDVHPSYGHSDRRARLVGRPRCGEQSCAPVAGIRVLGLSDVEHHAAGRTA